jgi:hypothetical protein
MIYYNHSLNLWSDNLQSVPNQATALRAKFRTWDARGFPAAGWVAVTESEPVYEGSPLTGAKVRTLDEAGSTYSWTVGGVHWSERVDTLVQARQRCREAIDGATSGAQQAVIPYTIPAGGKLNGVDAEGQTVDLWMIHPDVAPYWVDFKSMFDARGAFETEELDCTTGRVEIPGDQMNAVFALVATQGSIRRTGWRRLEHAFAAAETVEQYDAIRASIEGDL